MTKRTPPAALAPTQPEEPSFLARSGANTVRRGLLGGPTELAKSQQLMALGGLLLDSDGQQRNARARNWAQPLDESALPMLGQAAHAIPETVALLPFDWAQGWVPKLTSQSIHYKNSTKDGHSNAAEVWQQTWSPAVLMLGSPRYWEYWVEAEDLSHAGVSAPTTVHYSLGGAHAEALRVSKQMNARIGLIEALEDAGKLDANTPLHCPTLNLQARVPFALALVAMGTPKPARWAWPQDVDASTWWNAVASGLDEYPRDGAPLLWQLDDLARSGALVLAQKDLAHFDQPIAHSPWPEAPGIFVGRVLGWVLRNKDNRPAYEHWLTLATSTLEQGLCALDPTARQEMLCALLEDQWYRAPKTRRNLDLAGFAQHVLTHWTSQSPDRQALAQDLIRAAEQFSAGVLLGNRFPPTLNGLSLVEHTQGVMKDSTHPHKASVWEGALTVEQIAQLSDTFWNSRFGTQGSWPPPAFLFKLARAAPAAYRDAFWALAEDWAAAETDPERPAATRSLEFLGRYTQILARDAQPEPTRPRSKM